MQLSFYSEEQLKKLGFKYFGENVKVSKKCSIYAPEKISLGDNVRIDDFCILSGGEKGINIGSFVHIAAYSAIFGSRGITLGDFVGISSRSTIYSATDDYSGAFLTNPTLPTELTNVIGGEVMLEKHVIVGSNSTILPNVTIGEGSAIGAHSLVSKNLKPWGVYFGTPARRIKERKKDLLELEKKFLVKYTKSK